MKKNIGTADRIVRVLLAIVMIILYIQGVVTGLWGIVLLVLSGVFLLTSLVKFCPLYLPFGLRTTRPEEGTGKQE